MNKNIISRTLTSLFTCAMTGTMLIPAFTVNADKKIAIDKKNFPDEKFREEIGYCDEDQDGYLSSDEIKEITTFYCNSVGIKDLTGIEHFTELEEVQLEYNELTKVDFSNNTKLLWLDIANNEIDKLDLPKNTKLERLWIENNKLDKLDVSKYTELEVLGCGGNLLKTLDLSKNTKLEELYADGNKLTKLDLSKNTKLTDLFVSDTKLTNLDISKNTNLRNLSCGENPFEKVDLSKNTKLKKLWIENSKIKTLDLSNNTYIVRLELSNNNFEKLYLPKNNKLKELYINNSNKLDKLDLPYSPDLHWLECENNAITSLDLKSCPNLGLLNCSGNSITSLDLEHCPELQIVHCSKNAITSLTIKSCPKLREMDCSNNKLTSLDFKSCPKLRELDCSNNKLTSLDISANTRLWGLWCQSNQIDKLDISRCELLLKAFAGNKSNKEGYVYYTKEGYELAVDDKTKVISCLTVDDNTKHMFLDPSATVPLGFAGADSNTKVTMTSSDDSIVKIGDNNTLVTLKAGSSDIAAKVGNKEYKFKVTVYYKDVKDNTKFWFEPTYALTDKGVVKGYDNQTKFKPANKCTRAQMVTFIWRLAGSPEPKTKECKFSDVKKSDYFYKACLWGNENHIVEGYKDGTFGPQIVCARRHAVTFLWRLAGKPEPNIDKIKFTDVFKDINEDDYFYEACLWASEKKIVAGYEDNTFRPKGDCLRRQMVTFLYKYDKYVNNK